MEQDNLDATFDLPPVAKGTTKDSYSMASPTSSQGSPSMVGSEAHLVRSFISNLSHILLHYILRQMCLCKL